MQVKSMRALEHCSQGVSILIFTYTDGGRGGGKPAARGGFLSVSGRYLLVLITMFFFWRDFFGGIFGLFLLTDLRSTRSMVETETKSERSSQRGQENGRKRRYNKFYFLT